MNSNQEPNPGSLPGALRHAGAIHLGVGITGILAFLGTGQYMHLVHEHLQHMPDVPRLLFRSGHIYILMISLLNMLLGAYFAPVSGLPARLLQVTGSMALIAALGLVVTSFFAESLQSGIDRLLASLGSYLALAGVISHVIAAKIFAGRSP